MVSTTQKCLVLGSMMLFARLSYLWPKILTLVTLISFLTFITLRHRRLLSRRCSKSRPGPAATRKAKEYSVFVLGSGGHTREMFMMMDDGFHDLANHHRRYILTAGDKRSLESVDEYEDEVADVCAFHQASAGSYDVVEVARARRVHQPLWSVPWTALFSVLDILPALLRRPLGVDAYPGRIFSNGPATGFFVALVAHMLKVFYVVPEDCMFFIYIESWARISTMSLTGKMLYYTGIADVLVTQHEEVAKKYGLRNAGEMVFNSLRQK